MIPRSSDNQGRCRHRRYRRIQSNPRKHRSRGRQARSRCLRCTHRILGRASRFLHSKVYNVRLRSDTDQLPDSTHHIRDNGNPSSTRRTIRKHCRSSSTRCIRRTRRTRDLRRRTYRNPGIIRPRSRGSQYTFLRNDRRYHTRSHCIDRSLCR